MRIGKVILVADRERSLKTRRIVETMTQQHATGRLRRCLRPFRFAAVVALVVLLLLLAYIGLAGLNLWLARQGMIDPLLAWAIDDSVFDPLHMYVDTDGPGAELIQAFLRLCEGDL